MQFKIQNENIINNTTVVNNINLDISKSLIKEY